MTSLAPPAAITRSAGRRDRLLLAAVTAPPLVLAGVGLTHPHHLDATTATWWTWMHLLLIPVFPLLGVGHWLLLRRVPGVLPWVSRVAAFVFACFYTGLDAVAGVGNGVLMLRSGAADQSDLPEVGWLFGIGNELGSVGGWALVLAAVTTSAVLVRRAGVRALPGATLLVAATAVFSGEHIYFPVGVLAVVGIAVGSALLAAVARPQDVPASAADPAPTGPAPTGPAPTGPASATGSTR
ncbi:hypothetical protein CLV92_104280 [Kineococcus xinjiangensis]|uniref:Uncharacterized protein n=1 Tax=Kineococcus xinjiangensis TaxID=512762 RepID=A0A2S6IT91_9ACTN|nr:hypothetical protein [Kineococcus xinjiangensis]PPK97459.1 hypothetical protein CLV92_104280 [Kineococcus xinjiangensis]